MRERVARISVALLLVAVALLSLSACFPQSTVRGVGNEGGLVFVINPSEAEVLIDGVISGKASDFTDDRYLKVPSGTHRVEVRAPGYDPYYRDVYVSGSVNRIEASLVKSK